MPVLKTRQSCLRTAIWNNYNLSLYHNLSLSCRFNALLSYTGVPSCLFPSSAPFLFSTFSAFPSFCLLDLKDFQNNKHRYLLASENQRPGNFSTASMGSLTSSPSSCSLNSQVGLTSVTSIQERIMSTPGGEEAIERLKVGSTYSDSMEGILCHSTRQSKDEKPLRCWFRTWKNFLTLRGVLKVLLCKGINFSSPECLSLTWVGRDGRESCMGRSEVGQAR